MVVDVHQRFVTVGIVDMVQVLRGLFGIERAFVVVDKIFFQTALGKGLGVAHPVLVNEYVFRISPGTPRLGTGDSTSGSAIASV